jgi:hypothetical protein
MTMHAAEAHAKKGVVLPGVERPSLFVGPFWGSTPAEGKGAVVMHCSVLRVELGGEEVK